MVDKPISSVFNGLDSLAAFAASAGDSALQEHAEELRTLVDSDCSGKACFAQGGRASSATTDRTLVLDLQTAWSEIYGPDIALWPDELQDALETINAGMGLESFNNNLISAMQNLRLKEETVAAFEAGVALARGYSPSPLSSPFMGEGEGGGEGDDFIPESAARALLSFISSPFALFAPVMASGIAGRAVTGLTANLGRAFSLTDGATTGIATFFGLFGESTAFVASNRALQYVAEGFSPPSETWNAKAFRYEESFIQETFASALFFGMLKGFGAGTNLVASLLPATEAGMAVAKLTGHAGSILGLASSEELQERMGNSVAERFSVPQGEWNPKGFRYTDERTFYEKLVRAAFLHGTLQGINRVIDPAGSQNKYSEVMAQARELQSNIQAALEAGLSEVELVAPNGQKFKVPLAVAEKSEGKGRGTTELPREFTVIAPTIGDELPEMKVMVDAKTGEVTRFQTDLRLNQRGIDSKIPELVRTLRKNGVLMSFSEGDRKKSWFVVIRASSLNRALERGRITALLSKGKLTITANEILKIRSGEASPREGAPNDPLPAVTDGRLMIDGPNRTIDIKGRVVIDNATHRVTDVLFDLLWSDDEAGSTFAPLTGEAKEIVQMFREAGVAIKIVPSGFIIFKEGLRTAIGSGAIKIEMSPLSLLEVTFDRSRFPHPEVLKRMQLRNKPAPTGPFDASEPDPGSAAMLGEVILDPARFFGASLQSDWEKYFEEQTSLADKGLATSKEVTLIAWDKGENVSWHATLLVNEQYEIIGVGSDIVIPAAGSMNRIAEGILWPAEKAGLHVHAYPARGDPDKTELRILKRDAEIALEDRRLLIKNWDGENLHLLFDEHFERVMDPVARDIDRSRFPHHYMSPAFEEIKFSPSFSLPAAFVHDDTSFVVQFLRDIRVQNSRTDLPSAQDIRSTLLALGIPLAKVDSQGFAKARTEGRSCICPDEGVHISMEDLNIGLNERRFSINFDETGGFTLNAPAREKPPSRTHTPLYRGGGGGVSETPAFLRAGNEIYHMHYGTVQILAVEERDNGVFITFKPSTKLPLTESFRENLHINLADEIAVKAAIEHEANGYYRFFPLAVGIAYLHEQYARYESVLSKIYSRTGGALSRHIDSLYHYYANYLARNKRQATYYTSGRAQNWIGSIQREDLKGKFYARFNTGKDQFILGPEIITLAVEIFKRAGDDIFELGFRYFNKNMRAMVEALSSKPGSTGLESHRFNLSNDLLTYFTKRSKEFSVTTFMGPAEIKDAGRVFSVGDYDADRADYDALRDNDAKARGRWARAIAQIIMNEPRLGDADVIVPIPGREDHGMPVNALANEIGVAVNKPVAVDVFAPRPADRVAAESHQTFRDKEKEASRIYKLKGGEARFAGKKVIVVDDCYSSGAAFRAVAAELRKAGAEDVYLVTAVRNNRNVVPQSTNIQYLRSGIDLFEAAENGIELFRRGWNSVQKLRRRGSGNRPMERGRGGAGDGTKIEPYALAGKSRKLIIEGEYYTKQDAKEEYEKLIPLFVVGSKETYKEAAVFREMMNMDDGDIADAASEIYDKLVSRFETGSQGTYKEAEGFRQLMKRGSESAKSYAGEKYVKLIPLFKPGSAEVDIEEKGLIELMEDKNEDTSRYAARAFGKLAPYLRPGSAGISKGGKILIRLMKKGDEVTQRFAAMARGELASRSELGSADIDKGGEALRELMATGDDAAKRYAAIAYKAHAPRFKAGSAEVDKGATALRRLIIEGDADARRFAGAAYVELSPRFSRDMLEREFFLLFELLLSGNDVALDVFEKTFYVFKADGFWVKASDDEWIKGLKLSTGVEIAFREILKDRYVRDSHRSWMEILKYIGRMNEHKNKILSGIVLGGGKARKKVQAIKALNNVPVELGSRLNGELEQLIPKWQSEAMTERNTPTVSNRIVEYVEGGLLDYLRQKVQKAQKRCLIFETARLDDVTQEDWQRIQDVKRKLFENGTMELMAAAVSFMDERGVRSIGRLVEMLNSARIEQGRVVIPGRYEGLYEVFDKAFVEAWAREYRVEVRTVFNEETATAERDAIVMDVAYRQIDAHKGDISRYTNDITARVYDLLEKFKEKKIDMNEVDALLSKFEMSYGELANKHGPLFANIRDDLRGLKKGLTGEAKFSEMAVVEITGSVDGIAKSGSEPKDTCQRLTSLYSSGTNKEGQPVNTILYGQLKVANYIVDGVIAANMMVEITMDKNGNVYLFVDGLYTSGEYAVDVKSFNEAIYGYAGSVGIKQERVFFSTDKGVKEGIVEPLSIAYDEIYRDTEFKLPDLSGQGRPINGATTKRRRIIYGRVSRDNER